MVRMLDVYKRQEQCGEFSVSQANPAAPVDPAAQPAAQPSKLPSKLMIGDMELQSAESLASQGTREEASKYYHCLLYTSRCV